MDYQYSTESELHNTLNALVKRRENRANRGRDTTDVEIEIAYVQDALQTRTKWAINHQAYRMRAANEQHALQLLEQTYPDFEPTPMPGWLIDLFFG